MKRTNPVGAHEAEPIIDEYETLRANALGELNRPRMLTVFLRQGMSAWLHTLINSPASSSVLPATSPGATERSKEAAAADEEVAVLLADAILERFSMKTARPEAAP